jgi:hypothetical protein
MDQMPRSKFCARGPGIFPPLPDSMEFPDPFGWWVRRSVCSIALLLVCLDWKSDSFSYRTHLPFDSKVATLPSIGASAHPLGQQTLEATLNRVYINH